MEHMTYMNNSEKLVKETLEKLGFMVSKFENKGGYPDLIVDHNGKLFGARTLWVEVKRNNDGLSVRQIEMMAELRQKTYVAVVRTNEEIDIYRVKVTKTEFIPL